MIIAAPIEIALLTLAEARETIDAWRYDYNHRRPRSSLGALTLTEFAVLKGRKPPSLHEGEITGGLYLMNGGKSESRQDQ